MRKLNIKCNSVTKLDFCSFCHQMLGLEQQVALDHQHLGQLTAQEDFLGPHRTNLVCFSFESIAVMRDAWLSDLNILNVLKFIFEIHSRMLFWLDSCVIFLQMSWNVLCLSSRWSLWLKHFQSACHIFHQYWIWLRCHQRHIKQPFWKHQHWRCRPFFTAE